MSNSEMNTDNLLVTHPQNERLDSVNMTDIEAQNSVITQNADATTVPLRGILRRPEFNSPNIKDEAATIMIGKICISLLILVIMVPIIVTDLYFGFTDSSCVNDEPKNLAISMKLYLLVSGFVSLGSMIGILINICCFTFDEDTAVLNMCCISCIAIIGGVFHIIWNILGAIVFWGTTYGEGNCDKNISTYIFVSLIIKFVGNLFGIIQSKSEKKK